MRESIGGTLLMYLVIIFLFIYIVFMAVVINYGRVFRAKNSLISYIEAEEGFKGADSVNDFITKANSLNYRGPLYLCYTQGNGDTKYFSIRLAIQFDIPLTNGSANVWITGETSGIRNVTNNTGNNSIEECNATGNKFTNASKIRG
ncbi:MAG: hypothetical protein IJN90_03035 [Bacilli bacterium]|nr:hypothetical protein [Bacilli bacterium]